MKRGVNLSIGQQMWVGFGTAGLSLALVVAVVFSGLRTMGELRQQQTALIAPRSAAANDLETAILYKSLTAEGYVATHDDRDRLAYERVSQQASEVLLRLAGLADDQEGRALFAPLPELAQDFDRVADQIVAQARAGMTGAEAQQAEVRLARSRETLLDSLRRYTDLQEGKVTRARQAIAAEQTRTEKSLLAFSLLVLGLWGATGILAARGVRAPVKRLAAAARRVAAGDFSDVRSLGHRGDRRDGRESRNELDQLIAAFGSMAAALQVQHEELQAQNEELQAQQAALQAHQDELSGQDGELRCKSEELEEQGRSLQRVQEELCEANRRKDEFLATLSHELRNPLAPLHSSLYLLRRAEPGSDQANRMMAIMDRQLGHLTALTNDLLDVTRISRGKITLQCSTLDLCALVRSAADDNRALFASHALRLALEVPTEPLSVYADPARLAQVIGNLVHNAAKFTPADGEVAVTLARSPGQESARLIVRDTGTGIAPELLPQVFEPFLQGDQSLARSQGGLGLGLALVRALVEMHGGNVEAASDGPGRGSTFTVELPLCKVERESTPPPTLLQRTRRRVLVIEDNLDAANSLRGVLEMLGHWVETASDGHLGLSRAREFRPEVVFCDIGLPEMDGYAVARALRQEVQLRNALLVAMTGYAQPEDKRRATEAGFHEHVAKPPSIERLEEVLSRAGLSPS